MWSLLISNQLNSYAIKFPTEKININHLN